MKYGINTAAKSAINIWVISVITITVISVIINIAVLSNLNVTVISDFNIAPRINFLKKEVQDSIKSSNCTWPTLKTSSQLTDLNISTDF